MSDNGRQYFVAIIGGAIAGSVAAEILAERGTRVAVIEQNKRPYGKIEDGLPRWHVEQRKQEYARIDARLKKPGVFYVCAEHVRQLGGESPLDNLMEVKS
jgi:choline dehydrogenase-like flavoprotein